MSRKAIDTLMTEHREVLDRLESMRKALEAEGLAAAPSLQAWQVLREVGGFLAGDVEIHLQKEEKALFPALEAVMGKQGGPLMVMEMEHQEFRALLDSLQKYTASAAGPASPEEGLTAARIALGLADLLSGHIYKEDQILFPMALQVVPDQAWPEVDARMEAVAGVSG